MPTINDVARAAGVSRSTVSLVLNDSPLVKRETRELVKRVIRETGYVPNVNARSLSWRATKCLGIVVLSDQPRTAEYDFSQPIGLFSLNVIRGITSRLAESGYSVSIEYTSGGAALPRIVGERRVDGVLLVGGYCEDEMVRMIHAAGIPAVTVGVGAPRTDTDSVFSDPEEGTLLMLRHLRSRGYGRVALVNCPAAFASAQLREDAVKRFCGETGEPFDPRMIISCAHNSGASAYEAFGDAWRAGFRCDAFAAANAQTGLGAMRFLLESGIRVPEDVGVAAYEDNSLCGFAVPPVTAVNIQKERIGQEAAALMLERLKDPEAPFRAVSVPMYLTVRGST